ncbi:hypothetical protein BT67DRAFT_223319 [Trichocladium antarcticum]|uniref:Uncharacterized protein n=1 Tax=Trichocladium antarcticum TaxID=1450529 RepID=A0AAN6UER4_9PEZI|nr:hypothetical protein BT67DRAFT_223319 [Trichocladium antarcticum]
MPCPPLLSDLLRVCDRLDASVPPMLPRAVLASQWEWYRHQPRMQTARQQQFRWEGLRTQPPCSVPPATAQPHTCKVRHSPNDSQRPNQAILSIRNGPKSGTFPCVLFYTFLLFLSVQAFNFKVDLSDVFDAVIVVNCTRNDMFAPEPMVLIEYRWKRKEAGKPPKTSHESAARKWRLIHHNSHSVPTIECHCSIMIGPWRASPR